MGQAGAFATLSWAQQVRVSLVERLAEAQVSRVDADWAAPGSPRRATPSCAS